MGTTLASVPRAIVARSLAESSSAASGIEEIAPDLIAAMEAQELQLLRRLHALRDDVQPQAVR